MLAEPLDQLEAEKPSRMFGGVNLAELEAAAKDAAQLEQAQEPSAPIAHAHHQVPIKPKLSTAERATKHAPTTMPIGCILKRHKTPQKVVAPLEGTYKWVRKDRHLEPLQVAQQVHKGQLLGFIEVMSTQCMIQAPCSGVIEALYVDHGKRVALDQCLMIINPIA